MALGNKEVYDRIIGTGGFYANGLGGNSTLWDDYRNAQLKQNRLDDLWAQEEVDKDYYNQLSSSFGADKAAAGIQMGITGLNGLAGIAGQSIGLSRNPDQQIYDMQVNDLARQGAYNYSNFDQMSRDLASMQFLQPNSYKDVRGMTKGQEWGSVGATALSGASTGFQMFGPWGALGGAVIGGLAGLGGMASGRRKAATTMQAQQNNALIATDSAQTNYQAGHNKLAYNNNVKKAVNVGARGGQMGKKQQNIREFANRVMGYQDRRKTGDITISHGEGGTKIRIKR